MIDRAIMNELQRDGRLSNQELSERVGLSPSPCLRRVRHLQEAGVIRSYVALADPARIGFTVTAFVRVRLNQQDDRHLEAFEQATATMPEVMECYLMTGDADYQLRVLVASLLDFEDFLRAKLTKIEGVAQVTTSFALRPTIYKTAVPL